MLSALSEEEETGFDAGEAEELNGEDSWARIGGKLDGSKVVEAEDELDSREWDGAEEVDEEVCGELVRADGEIERNDEEEEDDDGVWGVARSVCSSFKPQRHNLYFQIIKINKTPYPNHHW